MECIVTLNELMNIDDIIENNAKSSMMANELLTERVYSQYNIVAIKKKLVILFTKFRSARYLYDFPVSDSIQITTNFEQDESYHQRSTVSKVENAVSKYVDKQILISDIYHSILHVSKKLVSEEVIYMIHTFLQHSTEEDIAEILGMSKTSLQKYKKSCIVKMWTELKQYCETDD